MSSQLTMLPPVRGSRLNVMTACNVSQAMFLALTCLVIVLVFCCSPVVHAWIMKRHMFSLTARYVQAAQEEGLES